MIKLVISDNEGTTTVVPLVRDEISIGRKEGNTIRLTERNISREHCRLQRHNGSYVVHDLRSYNGVILNGQRIAGESAVKAGDELRIGDYTLQLQLEERERKDDSEGDATRVSAPSRPVTAARLVVLTPPLEGAEFPLPERGELKLGRAPELDVFIDHRSVSREHAKIACDAGVARIIDAGGVNGVVVNREKVSEARLAAGDVIELGDVLVRYVAAGEVYVFDPADARALAAPKRPAVQSPQLIAVAIVAVAVLVGIVIARGGRETPTPEPKPKPDAHKAVATSQPSAQPAAAVTQPIAQTAETDHFTELLDSCRQANEGGRYAEAIAHANAALKARPDAPDAIACQESARINHEQEQIYVRGKAAFEAGDGESAWRELASLSPTGAVRRRPEVAALLAQVASKRLAQGQAFLQHKRPEQAADLAASILMVVSTDEIRTQAQALADKATAAARTTKNKAEATAHAAAEPHPKAAAAAHPTAAPRQPAANEKSAMEAATACLARGDNACVVRTLSGRAQTAQELGLLVETYRAMGDTPQAYRNMAVYVQRFPTARRAEAYRQMLERQGQ